MINRLILWLALAGMILALHLWIQKTRGFDQGCLGLEKPVLVEKGDCVDVSALPASHLLGVSNAAWGYAFYFGLALLSFGKLVASAAWARRLHRAGEAGVVLGSLYTAYLVYQMAFVARAWCHLCGASAGLMAVLFTLHLVLRRRGGFVPPDEPERTAEFRAAVVAAFGALGMLVGVLIFVNRLGTRPLDQGQSAREIEDAVGNALPVYIEAAKLREMRACHLDASVPALDLRKVIGPSTPFLGKPDGVPVIAFFDPNCGHCRQYHPVFMQVAEKYRDVARFYVLPRMLWDESALQVAALQLAEPSGKYFALWERMFAKPKAKLPLFPVADLTAFFRELGLDESNLEARLNALQGAVLARRDALKAAGIGALPVVYVGGRQVWMRNRSAECLGRLVEEARAERPAK